MLARRSLRTKTYLLLAPAVLAVLVLAWSAASPYRRIGGDVDTTRKITAIALAGERFSSAIARQSNAYSHMVLDASADGAEARAASRDAARELARWQALVADRAAGDAETASGLAEVRSAYDRLDAAGRQVEELLLSGQRADAAALVTGTIEPLIEEVTARADAFGLALQEPLFESLFGLAGVLDRADPLGFGGPNVDTGKVTLDLTRAVYPESLARLALKQSGGYVRFLLTGEQDEVAAAKAAEAQSAATLAAMREFAIGAGGRPATPGGGDEVAALATALGQLGEAGQRVVDAAQAGDPDGAHRVLDDEVRPLLASSILPTARALTTAGERALESSLADIDSGVAQVQLQLNVVLALAALMIVVVPIVATRRLVRPILHLKETAAAVGAGDLDARATTSAGGEIGELAAAFNAMVAELRTSSDALVAAREEAVRASGAKNEFLSRMSHELRTPLNAILGFGQLLEAETLSEEQRDSLEQILRAGRHLLDLINEVLDISRIEGGHLSVSLEPVRLRDALEEALDLIRPLAASHDVLLPSALPASCDVHVHADRQRLKQVLLNLLANGVKYNRAGGAVSIACEPMPGDRVRIGVRDTGWGIAEDRIERLFTPFDRLGAEQSSVVGTGLGLALAKRLTEAMEGTIAVESAAGDGSVFWVELARATPLEDTWSPERTLLPAASTPAGDGRTVLYIEDNLSNLRLVERIFGRWADVTLLPAMQGSLGLVLARDHQPDLVLLDLNLPDLSGTEVLARLKERPETRDIPVVVVSADATPGQVQRLLDAGAADYVTKPFDVSELLRAASAAMEP